MEFEAVLEQILDAAKRDENVLRALLATEDDQNPVSRFCAVAREMGFSVSEMDLIYAGEEAYAAMRRSTNGGGENSPALSCEEDYYELFMTKLKMLAESGKCALSRAGGTVWLTDVMEDPFLGENTGSAPFEGCVGVFDSGVGGLSVLSEEIPPMPPTGSEQRNGSGQGRKRSRTGCSQTGQKPS